MNTYIATIWYGAYSFIELLSAEDSEAASISAELAYPKADMIVVEETTH